MYVVTSYCILNYDSNMLKGAMLLEPTISKWRRIDMSRRSRNRLSGTVSISTVSPKNALKTPVFGHFSDISNYARTIFELIFGVPFIHTYRYDI